MNICMIYIIMVKNAHRKEHKWNRLLKFILISIVGLWGDFLFELLKLITWQRPGQELWPPLHQIPHELLHLTETLLLTGLMETKKIADWSEVQVVQIYWTYGLFCMFDLIDTSSSMWYHHMTLYHTFYYMTISYHVWNKYIIFELYH